MKQQVDPKRLLVRLTEAAELTGCGESTIRRWRHQPSRYKKRKLNAAGFMRLYPRSRYAKPCNVFCLADVIEYAVEQGVYDPPSDWYERVIELAKLPDRIKE